MLLNMLWRHVSQKPKNQELMEETENAIKGGKKIPCKTTMTTTIRWKILRLEFYMCIVLYLGVRAGSVVLQIDATLRKRFDFQSRLKAIRFAQTGCNFIICFFVDDLRRQFCLLRIKDVSKIKWKATQYCHHDNQRQEPDLPFSGIKPWPQLSHHHHHRCCNSPLLSTNSSTDAWMRDNTQCQEMHDAQKKYEW